MWIKTSEGQIHVPSFEDAKKNLALKRRLEEGEKSKKQVGGYGKESTKGHKKTCSECKQVGHTKRTYNFEVIQVFLDHGYEKSPSPHYLNMTLERLNFFFFASRL